MPGKPSQTGLKVCPGINAIAHCFLLPATKKFFTTLTPGVNVINLFGFIRGRIS